jgi:hypothetical protein
MIMENLTDDQILNFLDGTTIGGEREKALKLIELNPDVRKRVEELKAVHLFLQNQNHIEQPSRTFTERVMAGLHTRPSFSFLSPRNGLLLLAGLMVASGLAIMLVNSGTFDQWHAFFNIGQIPLKYNVVKLPATIPFDLKLAVKIFVMINVAIGFVLLDRTILRPFFQRRAERFS